MMNQQPARLPAWVTSSEKFAIVPNSEPRGRDGRLTERARDTEDDVERKRPLVRSCWVVTKAFWDRQETKVLGDGMLCVEVGFLLRQRRHSAAGRSEGVCVG